MNIEFATCVRVTAFGYLQKVYPKMNVTEEMVSKLLDLVQKDIVRVQDPYMYGNRIGIVAGNNYNKEKHTSLINEAISQLHENNLK